MLATSIETSSRPRATKPASPLSPCAAQEWHQPVFRLCGTSEGSKPSPAACTLSTEHVLRSWTDSRSAPTARATQRRAADQNKDRCSALQNCWGDPPRCVGTNAAPHHGQQISLSIVIAVGRGFCPRRIVGDTRALRLRRGIRGLRPPFGIVLFQLLCQLRDERIELAASFRGGPCEPGGKPPSIDLGLQSRATCDPQPRRGEEPGGGAAASFSTPPGG
jgi:hypothetical protein